MEEQFSITLLDAAELDEAEVKGGSVVDGKVNVDTDGDGIGATKGTLHKIEHRSKPSIPPNQIIMSQPANDNFSLHDDEELSLNDDASLFKDQLRRFHGMDDAKESGLPSRQGNSLEKRDSLAMDNENEKNIDTTVNRMIYTNNLSTSSSKHNQAKAQEVLVLIPLPLIKQQTTATPDQIDDMDLGKEMGYNVGRLLMTAIKIKKNASFKGSQGTVAGQEAANQIFEKDEKLKKYRRIGMKAVKDKDALQKIVDSWFASSKNLWKLIDCGMSSTVKIGLGYGIQSNAEVLGYEEEISRGIFAFRETNAGYYDIPLYSRFKQVEYKGVPHPLSGDYTPREQEDIDDSLYEYGKYGPQPQSPSPTVSDASSTHYSTCPSNDSDGELGAVSDHSVNDDPIHDHIPIPSIEQVTIATQKTQPQVPKPKQTVDPSCAQHVKSPRQPIRTPVTSSPIPSNNRQNWNQRMERELDDGKGGVGRGVGWGGGDGGEAALKSQRVVHANVRQATPAWTNTNRVNKANQFTPRPVQLSNIRPNLSTASKTIKTGRVNVNTGHEHVNSVCMLVLALKLSLRLLSRFNTGKQTVNSGSVHVNTARVNRPVSNNTSPKLSQVNLKSPKKCFSKQRSPVNRPFSRNTAHKSNKYAVKGKMGTAVKTSAGCVWRRVIPLSNPNSGPTPNSNDNVSRGSSTGALFLGARGIFDSGCSGHMTGNRAHLEDYQEPNPKWDLLLLRKRLGHLNFKNLNKLVKGNLVRGLPSKSFKNDHTCVACQKGKQHKASWNRDIGTKEVIDIDVQTEEAADLLVVSSTSLKGATRKAADSEKIATKKPSSTPISKSADDIMTFRKELDALALKHLGPVPATAPTSTTLLIIGSDNLNTGFEEVTTGI
ncbi:ribonuclease H-like domain-containing protein [Tanacetum coccineum]